nr:DUF6004 family protein [Nonomuraea sp. MG754425]
MHVAGQLKDLEPTGSELTMSGPDAALVTADGTVKARLAGARPALREAFVGEHAAVNI